MSVAQGRLDVEFAIVADEPILGLLRTAEHLMVDTITIDPRGIRWITFSMRLTGSTEQTRLSVQTFWDKVKVPGAAPPQEPDPMLSE